VLDGKGVLNNRISEYMMLRLGEIGIPTHFMKRLNMREQLCKKVEIVPLEVIVRNVAAGSMSKRLGIEEGEILSRPIVEFCLKRDDLGDPLVAEEHVTAFGWASADEVEEIIGMTLRINDYLCGLFAGVGIRLIDFKIEYGRLPVNGGHQIVLADEISPDSCRLWDRETNKKLDKDRFRRDLGRAIARSLNDLGFGGVKSARQGKVIELDLTHEDASAAKNDVTEMCEKLLANTVIESYRIDILEDE